MKFSRAKLQHLKWLRRKELIRINCFIMVAILLMVLLFMGFPIVSNAESAYTYDDTLPAHLGISDTDILVPRNITQEEGYCYLMANDNKLVYFDDDMTNGAIIWDSSIDDYEYNVSHGDWSSTYTVADAQSYRAYFTSNNGFVIDFYMTELSRYVTFQENANNNSKTSMCYIGPYGYNGSSWDLPVHNYQITVSFTRNTSDNNFYVSNYLGISGSQAFTANQRYYDGDLCYYGVYGQVYILGNIDAVALPIEPYLKRASYHEDPNDNTSDWVTDWVNADGISYNPNYSSGTSPDDKSYILDGDFIFDNSNIFVSGQSANNYDLVCVLDFPEETDFTQYDYILNMDSSVSCYFIHDNKKNVNFTSYYGVQNYGSVQSGNINDYNEFSFSGSYQGSIESNVFKIPSSTLNTFMSDAYTASQYGTSTDFVVNPSEFFNRVSQLKILNYYNIPEILARSIMDSLNIKNSMPYYENDTTFQLNNAVFTYSLDLYKDGAKITSVPLSCEYDVINGTSTVTSNPGYNKDVVNQVITDNNNDVNNDPTNPNYKNPDNYLPTVETEPNIPSDQTNNNNNSNNISGGNNSVNVVNSPSVTISQGNKYPEKGVMNSFVRIINNDKNNTVNDIDTLIGGSAYIQLMNNALVAVPDQVWSIWITALKAILGIAVSAFFLKILINWAT